MGIHLEAQSAAVLNFNVGGDLERLYSDMEKLKLLAGTATITPEMVAQHIGFSKTYNNFELVNALAEKNFTQAMHIALHMGQNPKQHPLVVTLSTVFSFFQRLLLFHSSADNRKRRQYWELSLFCKTIYCRKFCTLCGNAVQL